jgi:hypothetical protein
MVEMATVLWCDPWAVFGCPGGLCKRQRLNGIGGDGSLNGINMMGV